MTRADATFDDTHLGGGLGADGAFTQKAADMVVMADIFVWGVVVCESDASVMAVMRISDVAKRRSAEKRKWITPASGVCGSASANTKKQSAFFDKYIS